MEQTNEAGIANSSARVLPAGTVALSRTASVGFVTILGREMATSQDFVNWVCGSDLDPHFLSQLFTRARSFIRSLSSGAIHKTVYVPTVKAFFVCIPSVEEQRRIALRLESQLAIVAPARAAAEARLEAARRLPISHLKAMFSKSLGWSTQPLEEVADLLPSRSIVLSGSAQVRVVTTACLTERGFDSAGVKDARMADEVAASESRLVVGEILVARSNTAELVGRAAKFEGDPAGVVASDLTIRVMPRKGVVTDFLASYLAFLYSSGYWKEKSGGASGSMKKITRTQLSNQPVPVPQMDEQLSITRQLNSRMAESRVVVESAQSELAAIADLPGALLRRAFRGEL